MVDSAEETYLNVLEVFRTITVEQLIHDTYNNFQAWYWWFQLPLYTSLVKYNGCEIIFFLKNKNLCKKIVIATKAKYFGLKAVIFSSKKQQYDILLGCAKYLDTT